MMEPMTSGVCAIEVTGLRKSYGSQHALRGVDFTVARGEVFGLLGPNGAGKTTCVEVLEGYRARDAGGCSATTPAIVPWTCAPGSASSSRVAAPIRI
jgi:ABC-type sugar transport system ATPase subunit